MDAGDRPKTNCAPSDMKVIRPSASVAKTQSDTWEQISLKAVSVSNGVKGFSCRGFIDNPFLWIIQSFVENLPPDANPCTKVPLPALPQISKRESGSLRMYAAAIDIANGFGQIR
jgi:hypothetical protein